MKIDMLVVRHSSSGAAHYLARVLHCPVINAGDGCHEHPTQGLLDIMTMRQRLGDLRGKKVTIIGDIAHSRVARSNIWGLTKLGAEVTVCGPPTMVPGGIAASASKVEYDLLRAVADADVLNVLRIQLERHSPAERSRATASTTACTASRRTWCRSSSPRRSSCTRAR
jgi:aspartate carbamoyltransferase catalytic subunit